MTTLTLDTLLVAIAIAFIIEGFFPAFFPNKWRNYIAKLAQEPVSNIRRIGLMVMLSGVVMLAFFMH